jgi:hypothetical protein
MISDYSSSGYRDGEPGAFAGCRARRHMAGDMTGR